jgi:hypothetical protein
MPGEPVVEDLRFALRHSSNDAAVKRKPIELAIDVELPQARGIAGTRSRRNALKTRGKVQLVETVHLRHVRHDGAAARAEGPADGMLFVALHHEHRVLRHVGNDVALALGLRLARCDDVHHEMLNTAVRSDHDLCVPLPHARKSVNRVARQRVPATRHVFYRDRIAPYARDERVLFRGSALTA